MGHVQAAPAVGCDKRDGEECWTREGAAVTDLRAHKKNGGGEEPACHRVQTRPYSDCTGGGDADSA